MDYEQKNNLTMNDKIDTEQPLMMEPQCVECKFYDGFGQCLEHGDMLKDDCKDFELIED